MTMPWLRKVWHTITSYHLIWIQEASGEVNFAAPNIKTNTFIKTILKKEKEG